MGLNYICLNCNEEGGWTGHILDKSQTSGEFNFSHPIIHFANHCDFATYPIIRRTLIQCSILVKR